MISLHEPSFDETDESYILEALRSSWVSTGGPFVDRFEQSIAEYTGAGFAVSTVNGTTALHLMLETLKHQQGVDRSQNFDVLIPSLTFIATANAVVHSGGNPVLLDSTENSLNLRPARAMDFVSKHYNFDSERKKWFSKDTKNLLLAFTPVHIMGWASYQPELEKLSSEMNVCVLEDAAEALGTFSSDGKHAGRSGLASALSFNGNKILTTGGGGMILTDNEEFAKLAKHLSTTAKIDGLKYVHDEVGYNYRLVNLLAALGCSQLKKMNESLAKKKSIFNSYKEILGSKGEALRIYEEQGSTSNNWLVNLVFAQPESKERALRNLQGEGIGARPLWTPIHLQPAFADSIRKGAEYPNAEHMWKRVLSLPSSPHLSLQSIERICEVILKSLD